MGLFNIFKISASGLQAQRLRMEIVSSNLANANTTRTENGKVYQRLVPIFQAIGQQASFEDVLAEQRKLYEVRVKDIKPDGRDPIWIYDPSHPDADKDGYVAMPNINVVEEMVNLMSAARSFDANINSIQAAKKMADKALDLGR